MYIEILPSEPAAADRDLEAGYGMLGQFKAQSLPISVLKRLVVGRDLLLKTILRHLDRYDSDAIPQAILLVGEEGVGKTTILRLVRHSVDQEVHLARSWLPIELREEPYGITTIKDLFVEMLFKLQETLEVSESALDSKRASA